MPKKYIRLADRDKANGTYSPIFFFDCLPGEIWRPITDKSIPNVSPVYYVSNYGRLYTAYYYKPRLLRPSNDGKGYLQYGFWTKDGNKICRKIHRCEMIEFCYIPGYENLEVNHIDGNKNNNWIGNLEWCTHEENMHHAQINGLEDHIYRTGEDAHNSTITNAQAEEIGRLLSEQKYTRDEIADIVGCSKDTVHCISSGTSWKSIYDKYNLGSRPKCRADAVFSLEEVKLLCQYFQDNYKKYNDTGELFDSGIKKLFPERIEFDYKRMRDNARRIYKREIYADISSKYEWAPYY